MYHKAIILCAALSASVAAGAQDEAYLSADFNAGIPSDFTLVDMDENPVSAPDYQRATLGGSWAANIIDTRDNMAAFSFSSCNYDYPTENWMMTPAVRIASADACLRWDAKSVHYDLREDYKVMISTSPSGSTSDFRELASFVGEGYSWTTHVIPLGDYAGQDVRIAFVATSQNKYILAVDNVFIGVPGDYKFAVKSTSRRFVGSASATAPVSGTATNIGKGFAVEALRCVTDGGTLTSDVPGQWNPGEALDYSFDIPVSLGKASHYRIEAVPAGGGEPVAVCEDSVVCSYFPKTLLVEEGTGTWCNNCPMGILQVYRLKEMLGDEVVAVAVHVRDALFTSDYYNFLGSIPAIKYNRRSELGYASSAFDNEIFGKAMALETPAYIEMSVSCSESAPGTLSINAHTQFAREYDNSTGRYRIGFALVDEAVAGDDPVLLGALQQNSSTLVSSNEFYYLPLDVPADLMFYHDVVREASTAFDGVEGSLPGTISVGETYEMSHTLAIPEAVQGESDLVLVGFVLDTLADIVLNVTSVPVPSLPSGIDAVGASGADSGIGVAVDGGEISLSFPSPYEPYSVTVTDLGGVVLQTAAGSGATGEVRLACPGAKSGCVVVRAVQGRNAVARKLFVK